MKVLFPLSLLWNRVNYGVRKTPREVYSISMEFILRHVFLGCRWWQNLDIRHAMFVFTDKHNEQSIIPACTTGVLGVIIQVLGSACEARKGSVSRALRQKLQRKAKIIHTKSIASHCWTHKALQFPQKQLRSIQRPSCKYFLDWVTLSPAKPQCLGKIMRGFFVGAR